MAKVNSLQLGAPTAMSSAWNRQKVSSLYSLAHSKDKLPWMSPEIVGIIDTANKYQTDTGTDALPTELAGILGRGITAVFVYAARTKANVGRT